MQVLRTLSHVLQTFQTVTEGAQLLSKGFHRPRGIGVTVAGNSCRGSSLQGVKVSLSRVHTNQPTNHCNEHPHQIRQDAVTSTMDSAAREGSTGLGGDVIEAPRVHEVQINVLAKMLWFSDPL
jgi:hypothetical protein